MSGFVQSGRFSTAAWTPLSLGSTLKLWLDAADAATITYSTGTYVSQWADKSGNANHATQPAGDTQRPDLLPNIVNGLPGVYFQTDDALQITNFASGFTAGEVFIVVKLNADPAGSSHDSGFWKFTSDTTPHVLPFTDGNFYDGWGSTARKSTGNPSASFTSPRLYNVRSASGAWSSHVDGTQHYTTATNTVGFGSGTHYIGGWGAAYFMQGYVMEMIMTDSVLSTGDRASVKSYIATKYALTIA